MNLLIDSSDCISIPYFEFSKLLVMLIQPIIEMRNRLSLFTIFYLSNQSFHFNHNIALHLGEHFQQFGMTILIFLVV